MGSSMDFALLKYRVEQAEGTLEDHEPRIRKLEELSIKLGAYATIGSVVGGVITSLIVQWLSSK